MKKRNIKDILGNAGDKDIKRISDSYCFLSSKKTEQLYSRIAENADLTTDTEYTDKVSGVEVSRNSNFLRYIASAAACVAVIGGLSAGAFAMKSMKKIPSPDLSETAREVTETATEKPNTEETAPDDLPKAFNDEEKLRLYDLMINSVDNFSKVSGEYVVNDTNSDIACEIVEYQYDMKQKKGHKYMSRENITSSLDDAVNDKPFTSLPDNYLIPLDFYFENNTEYYIDSQQKIIYEKNFLSYTDVSSSRLDPRTVAGTWYSRDKNVNYNADYSDENSLRYDYSFGRATSESVYPSNFACGQLYDFTAWEITGEVNYAGRVCIGIEGKIPYYPYEPSNKGTGDFKALIDKETGCLLKYVIYDPNGGYINWLVTKSIKFDDEADSVSIDLSEYSDYVPENVSYEIKYNSKGESYGFSQMAVDAYNYDDLPDLIAYKGAFTPSETTGYMRKTELFEVFPISPSDQSKRYASTIKGENTPEGIDINIYDSEGENVLYVVTYYNPPVYDEPCMGHTDSYLTFGQETYDHALTFGPMTADDYDNLPDLIRYAVPDDPDDTVCYIVKSDIADIIDLLPRELYIGNCFRWKNDTDINSREITCYNLYGGIVGTLVYDPQN